MPFLGEIPLNAAIREGGDTGTPILVGRPDAPESEAFRSFAQATAARVSVLQSMRAQEAARGPRQFIKFFDK